MTRRFFQFSLATMLVFVAAICVVLAIRSNRQHNRRVAIAKIEKLGGDIISLTEFEASPRITASFGNPEIGLLGRLLGDNPDTYVVRVYLEDNSKVTDADLACLLWLPELRYLVVRNAINISDKGIARFQEAMPKCQVTRPRSGNPRQRR